MAQTSEANPLLRRPLYVFDLPPELLASLTLSTLTNQKPVEHTEPSKQDLQSETKASEDRVSPLTSCALCHASFDNVHDQREHVRSDFHRYNLKLGVKQLPPLDEQTFTRLIGDLDESISGSDSSESEDDESQNDKDTTLIALLKKQAKLSSSTQETAEVASHKSVASNAPMLWLSSSQIGNEHVLGIYKAILPKDEQTPSASSLTDFLRKKQLTPVHAKHSGTAQANGAARDPTNDPHYFLCMIGGGHFAGIIVSLVPELRKGPGGIEERHAVVKAHKTFHRYTTRRKQGGAQSANDNAKGNAHSVGSNIRRANEAALEAEVRAILAEWKSMIDTAELIFIRATGSTNRRTLFGPYDGQVLNSRDPRLRGFPFSTRRATQAELLRSFQELTRLKVSTFIEETPPAPKAEPKPKSAKPKVESPQLSKEDEAAVLHTSQIQNLIRRSKAPALVLYLSNNELSTNFSFFPPAEHHHAPTPLHLAASTNSAAIITSLLTKGKADPKIPNGEGKTAYDLAGDQKTRDAFRVARHQLGEDAFDWTAAHVPPAMSQQEADSRSRADKAASDTAEAERRKADLTRLQEQEEQRNVNKMERKAGTGKSLTAAAEKTGAEKREENTRGLTPEQRMKLERERRARAAEDRLKRLHGS